MEVNVIQLTDQEVNKINEKAKRAHTLFLSDPPKSLVVMYVMTHLSDLTGIRFDKAYSIEYSEESQSHPHPQPQEGTLNPNMHDIHESIKKVIMNCLEPEEFFKQLNDTYEFIRGLISLRQPWKPAIFETTTNINLFGLDTLSDLFNWVITDTWGA